MHSFQLRKKTFYVKRDDLLDPLLSGNKYRKLYTLLHTSSDCYQTLVSYGGSQSNAMLSIAALCHRKGWEFRYYCRPIAMHLKQHVTGNLKTALELGMQLIETHDEQALIQQQYQGKQAKTLFVPQGGADPMAAQGIHVLAQEIKQWQQQQGINTLNLVTPSGTGTTAYYLAKAMPENLVFSTASVGDNPYLQRQIQQLGTLPPNLVLLTPSRRYHFAKPYPEWLAIHHELAYAGINFDLVYAPLMWQTLLQHQTSIQGEILYIHSGGLSGNATMLERYKHKGISPNYILNSTG